MLLVAACAARWVRPLASRPALASCAAVLQLPPAAACIGGQQRGSAPLASLASAVVPLSRLASAQSHPGACAGHGGRQQHARAAAADGRRGRTRAGPSPPGGAAETGGASPAGGAAAAGGGRKPRRVPWAAACACGPPPPGIALGARGGRAAPDGTRQRVREYVPVGRASESAWWGAHKAGARSVLATSDGIAYLVCGPLRDVLSTLRLLRADCALLPLSTSAAPNANRATVDGQADNEGLNLKEGARTHRLTAVQGWMAPLPRCC